MKAMLPQVRVFDENVFEQLLHWPEFQPAYVTQESKRRSTLYLQNQQRQELEAGLSREAFLMECRFTIGIDRMQPYEVDRVTELIQRTNQLNTSIKRYTKEEIIAFSHAPNCDIFAVNVSDKFGDYGLVGVCIAFREQPIYEIDTLLFSCRVMSKGVEDYTLTFILNHARDEGFDKAILRYKEGPRNEQIRTILEKNDFRPTERNGDITIYGFDLHDQEIKPFPKWFSCGNAHEEAEILAPIQA
jgi:FkbH-like protein